MMRRLSTKVSLPLCSSVVKTNRRYYSLVAVHGVAERARQRRLGGFCKREFTQSEPKSSQKREVPEPPEPTQGKGDDEHKLMDEMGKQMYEAASSTQKKFMKRIFGGVPGGHETSEPKTRKEFLDAINLLTKGKVADINAILGTLAKMKQLKIAVDISVYNKLVENLLPEHSKLIPDLTLQMVGQLGFVIDNEIFCNTLFELAKTAGKTTTEDYLGIMHNVGITPDLETCNRILRCLSLLNMVHEGFFFIENMEEKLGIKPDINSYNMLLSMIGTEYEAHLQQSTESQTRTKKIRQFARFLKDSSEDLQTNLLVNTFISDEEKSKKILELREKQENRKRHKRELRRLQREQKEDEIQQELMMKGRISILEDILMTLKQKNFVPNLDTYGLVVGLYTHLGEVESAVLWLKKMQLVGKITGEGVLFRIFESLSDKEIIGFLRLMVRKVTTQQQKQKEVEQSKNSQDFHEPYQKNTQQSKEQEDLSIDTEFDEATSAKAQEEYEIISKQQADLSDEEIASVFSGKKETEQKSQREQKQAELDSIMQKKRKERVKQQLQKYSSVAVFVPASIFNYLLKRFIEKNRMMDVLFLLNILSASDKYVGDLSGTRKLVSEFVFKDKSITPSYVSYLFDRTKYRMELLARKQEWEEEQLSMIRAMKSGKTTTTKAHTTEFPGIIDPWNEDWLSLLPIEKPKQTTTTIKPKPTTAGKSDGGAGPSAVAAAAEFFGWNVPGVQTQSQAQSQSSTQDLLKKKQQVKDDEEVPRNEDEDDEDYYNEEMEDDLDDFDVESFIRSANVKDTEEKL